MDTNGVSYSYRTKLFLVLSAVACYQSHGFFAGRIRSAHTTGYTSNSLSSSSSGVISSTSSRWQLMSSTWQEDLDELLDIDTPLQSRRDKTRAFIGRTREISNDVFNALRERDLKTLAPKNLKYGKALIGLRDFRKQLVNDIIPEVLTKGVPRLVEDGPKIVRRAAATAGSSSKKAVERARELARDGEKRAAKKEELKREIGNIVRSTPEGLEAPEYTLLQEREYYEIRKYSGYSVCSAPVRSEFESTTAASAADDEDFAYISGSSGTGTIEMDPLAVSSTFITLADYVFGNNTVLSTDSAEGSSSAEIGMTTPVIMEDGSMSFVLPKKYNTANAPIPAAAGITIRDVSAQLVAARQFTGLATAIEVTRQRAKLEDALISDGIVYDATTFKVLTYNPPFTLPWVRRNEVCFTVSTKERDLPLQPLSTTAVTVTATEAAAAIDTKAEDVTDVTTTTDSDITSSSSRNDDAAAEPAAKGAATEDEADFFTAPEAGD